MDGGGGRGPPLPSQTRTYQLIQRHTYIAILYWAYLHSPFMDAINAALMQPKPVGRKTAFFCDGQPSQLANGIRRRLETIPPNNHPGPCILWNVIPFLPLYTCTRTGPGLLGTKYAFQVVSSVLPRGQIRSG